MLRLSAITVAALALAWTSLAHAAVEPVDWYPAPMLIGFCCLLCSYLPAHPALNRTARYASISLAAYLVFQLVPLPIFLLEAIDPYRATLALHLQYLGIHAGPAPIAINQPGAVLWTSVLFTAAAIFWCVRRIGYRSSRYVTAIPFLAVVLLEAALGLLQGAAGSRHVSGTFASRDHYCFFMAIAVPIFGAAGWCILTPALDSGDRVFSLRRAAAACLIWVCGVSVLAAALLSLSRAGATAALVAAVGFLALCIFPRMRSRSARSIAVAVLLGSLLVGLFLFSPASLFNRLLSSPGADALTRLSIWRQSVPLFFQSPLFGVGLLGFEAAFLRFQNVALAARIDFAHNDYVQYLVELGALGFSMLAVLIVSLLWPLIRRTLASSRYGDDIWLKACLAAWCAAALHSIVDFNLYVPANVLALAWITALGLCASTSAD